MIVGCIKYLCLDVDGTMTDGKIYLGAEGEVMKAFDVKDGYAVARMLPEAGITPVILTARKSRIVETRARELGITEVYQDVADKAAKLVELAGRWGRAPANIAYIGDDLSDLPAMRFAGFSACPADAAEAVRAAVDYVSPRKGGDGAVREIVERLLRRGGIDTGE